MYMPSPQEASHRAQHDSIQKLLVCRVEPKFDEVDREERKREEESRRWSDVWENSEGCRTDQTARGRGESFSRDRDSS